LVVSSRLPLRLKSISGSVAPGTQDQEVKIPASWATAKWFPRYQRKFMHIQITMVLGMLLGCCVSAVAQTPAGELAPMQEPLVPIATMAQMSPTPLLARATLPPEKPGKYAAHFSYTLASTHTRHRTIDGLETLSQMREVKTLFVTKSSLPLLNLWGGRLRFDAFSSTINTQNVQLGPSAAGGLEGFRPPRQSNPGELRSVDLYGLSFSFHFGRDAQIGRPAQVWHSLARVIDAAR
jgi:hypothetical protein